MRAQAGIRYFESRPVDQSLLEKLARAICETPSIPILLGTVTPFLIDFSREALTPHLVGAPASGPIYQCALIFEE